MVEFSSITAAIAIGVGLWNLIRVEQVRRAGTDDALRQKLAEEVAVLHKRIEVEGSILREKLEIEHLKTSILEARLKPLLDSFDKRLAEMFHQPHPESRELDALLEKFDADPTGLKWSVREEELNRLIALLDLQQREKPAHSEEVDPFKEIWMTFSYASLKGIRDARVALRQEEHRDLALRDMLRSYLTRAPVQHETEESWWRRVKRWWRA